MQVILVQETIFVHNVIVNIFFRQRDNVVIKFDISAYMENQTN
jgi:hypothetical protein